MPRPPPAMDLATPESHAKSCNPTANSSAPIPSMKKVQRERKGAAAREPKGTTATAGKSTSAGAARDGNGTVDLSFPYHAGVQAYNSCSAAASPTFPCLDASSGYGSGNLPQPSQNFHFVGGTSHYATSMAPCAVTGYSSPIVETPTPHLDQDPIHVDSGDEVTRTDKRILWTQEEDLRLMSSWLKNSMDPINGADKRNNQYWGDVAKTYNMTTPKHRSRNPKQAKDRWHKINKWTNLFRSAWLKARKIFTSGHSDQMWIDKAHKFYEDDNKQLNLGHFVLMDVWYAVRNEPKWITYNNELKKARKRKASADVASEAKGGTNELEAEDIENLERPMGQKRAKKAAFDAKKEGKSKESAIDVEQLDKFSKVQAEAHTNRLKVLEVQQKLSAEKLEASRRLSHLAAMESKEAKILEKEAKMMETYNCLLSRDTRGLSDEEKAEHVAALRCLRKRLFPES